MLSIESNDPANDGFVVLKVGLKLEMLSEMLLRGLNGITEALFAAEDSLLTERAAEEELVAADALEGFFFTLLVAIFISIKNDAVYKHVKT